MKSSLQFLVFILLSALAANCPAQDGPKIVKTPYTFLLRWEGYRQSPYIDGKVWAVGVGHVLGPISGPRPKGFFTSDEVDAFYDEDLAVAERAARSGIRDFDTLPVNAQIVTISLIWSVGPTGFTRFVDYRKSLAKRKFRAAATALFRSKRWGQIGWDRANQEYDMLMAVHWELDE